MIKRIFKNRRGQIQGVDFALAMIVFMIMFAEVIVLSLSFLEPKYQNLEDRAFESRAEEISEAFFASAGYPEKWEYTYPGALNSFGLREIGSTALDANKLARVVPNSLYELNYEAVKSLISREEEIGFQLQLRSLFEVTGTFTMAIPTSSISVSTSETGCTIWVFVIGPTNEVIFTQRAATNSSGGFEVSFATSTLPNGYYTLVVFAKNSKGIFAVDYAQAVRGTYVDLTLKMLIQEDKNSNGRATIQASHNGSATSLSATIVYPYLIGGEANANDSKTIASPAQNEIFNLRLVTNGTSVVILSADSLLGAARTVGIYPAQLNQKFGSFGEVQLPENKQIVTIEKLVIIRECIFKAVLYLWSES
ncbi:MAG: hypothetical protein K9W42_02050 [Candidatus Heimdallarchaeota archaeon]|nr:hypothetical protein [Candidatus Heimdallarchaeota archaeon]